MPRSMKRWLFLMLSSSFVLSVPHLVQADASSLQNLRIGRISIDRENVFDLSDPKQNQFPYTWANKLHIVTREECVRRDLLFREGDLYTPQVIEESERLLRTRPIFRFVSIKADPPVNGLVDVHIQTKDVWTTSLELDYGYAGGKNLYQFGILEHNFLGTGNRVGVFAKQDIDRFIRGATYEDPHILGSRWKLFGGYGKDEKGAEWEGDLDLPYDSVLTPHAAGVHYHHSDNQDRLFEDGDESELFQHLEVNRSVFASAAVDANLERAHRLGVEYQDQKDQFSDIVMIQPEPTPVDRRVTGVLATYQFFQNDFDKRRGIRTFDRDEDINFGWNWIVKAGPELRRLGASQDGALGETRATRTWRTGEKSLLYTAAEIDGRLENGRVEDGVLQLNVESIVPEIFCNGIFSLRGEAELGKNLPAETQFLLGGENGLRAYSVRQFSGSRKLFFSAENRWNLMYDWMNLVHVGWAVFADSGGVWREQEAIRLNEFKNDAGVGFRFSPSRAFTSSLIRIDLAYAMNNNNQRSRLAVNIGGALQFGESKEKKFDQ